MNNTELLYGKLVPFVADILKYKNELVTSLDKNEDYMKKIQLLETTMIFYNDEKKRLFPSYQQQDAKPTYDTALEKKDTTTEEVNNNHELFWDAFTFNPTTEPPKQPAEEKAVSSSSDDSDSENTESEYEFSGDDKEETEKIEAIFEKSKIKLKKVRQTKGFIINRKTNFMHA